MGSPLPTTTKPVPPRLRRPLYANGTQSAKSRDFLLEWAFFVSATTGFLNKFKTLRNDHNSLLLLACLLSHVGIHVTVGMLG